MSMNPLVSSRLAIGNALVSLVTGVNDPATSQSLLSLVQLGAVFNPSSNAAWCEITHLSGQGKPAGGGQGGWRIDDETQWLLTCGIGPYETNSAQTQAAMLNVQDVLLPALHIHFQIPSASNPTVAVPSVYSVLPMQIDRSKPARFPNGHFYLLWSLPVTIRQQYGIVLTQP